MKYRNGVPMTCQICGRNFSTIVGLHTHFRFKHIHMMVWIDYIYMYIKSFCSINENGCWDWKGSKDKHGYGRIRIHKNITTGVHRMTYEHKYGEIPYNLEVLHKCDNPGCVNPNHLWIGTQKDNMQDASRKGRICHGDGHPWKKPEMRKKASIIHTGRKHTIESKIKMSKNNAMHKLENRMKVSKSKLGEKNYASKPVLINGIRYVSLTEAGKTLGVDPTTISYRIKNNKPGYKFVNRNKIDGL